MMRFRWALPASLIAACALAGSASAAVRTVSISDGIDAQDTTPTLNAHPVYPEVVAATVAYDDAAGTVHGTITFNIPTGESRPFLPDLQLLGAADCSDDASSGAAKVPALTIGTGGPAYGAQPVAATAQLAGYGGTAPVTVSLSPDGLTATFDTSHPSFAHRDWRCVTGTYSSGYDDDFSAYFPGFAPKELTTTTALAATDAELRRRYGDDYNKSDRRTWLRCPSSEFMDADADPSDGSLATLPTAFCQFRFADKGVHRLRHGNISIALKDGDLISTFFDSYTFTQKLRTCHIPKTYASSSSRIRDRSLRADGFVACTTPLVDDLSAKPKPGIKRVGFLGTSPAGFGQATGFRCRTQRAGSRYTARCANQLGDRFIYTFTVRAKP